MRSTVSASDVVAEGRAESEEHLGSDPSSDPDTVVTQSLEAFIALTRGLEYSVADVRYGSGTGGIY